jgi:transposase
VSHVSIQKWIKKFGPELEELKSENEISVVELHEMHTYIGNKKNIAGSGLLLIELGKNSSTALLANRKGNWTTALGKVRKQGDRRSND